MRVAYIPELFRQAADYEERILRREKSADLPTQARPAPCGYSWWTFPPGSDGLVLFEIRCPTSGDWAWRSRRKA
jgi:hypothetical protein